MANTVARLQRAGLVASERYRSIFLTEEGRELAERCRRRHEAVFAFLRFIGVGEEAARRDAEGIEHHVGEETLTASERLMRESGRGTTTRARRRDELTLCTFPRVSDHRGARISGTDA